MTTAKNMAFRHFGRTCQLRIETAEDLALVPELDEAHWMALGAPVESLNCDAGFLAMVDSDHDERIMCFDVCEAVKWLFEHLRDTSGIADASTSLKLDAIDTDSASGRDIHDSAVMILQRLGANGDETVTLDQVRQVRDMVEKNPVSKTDVVPGDIGLTEKLLLYQGYLLALANNFVSFPHLYDPNRRAMFERGTLIMDGRHFDFCILATDRAAHAKVAATGNTCVLYVEVSGPDTPAFEVAVPVTSGGLGNLCLGKRGMFRTVDGAEADACVVQIIENPISICEALVSPFQRLGRLLSGKIEAITARTEKTPDAKGETTADRPEGDRPAGKTDSGHSRGLLAGGLLVGGSVAVAALTSAAAYITKTLAGVETYKILIGIGVAVVAVMLPTSIVAILKLRRRDLSALLEGSGWAINARMRLTFRQGRFFTSRPPLPGSVRGVVLRHKRLSVALFIALCHGIAFFFIRLFS